VTEDATSDGAYVPGGQEPTSQRNARSQPIRYRLSAIRDSLSVRNLIVSVGVVDEHWFTRECITRSLKAFDESRYRLDRVMSVCEARAISTLLSTMHIKPCYMTTIMPRKKGRTLGKANKTIAHDLALNEGTIKAHIRNIMKRWGHKSYRSCLSCPGSCDLQGRRDWS